MNILLHIMQLLILIEDATGALYVKDLGQLASIINQLREVEHIQYQKYLEKQKPIVKNYGGILWRV